MDRANQRILIGVFSHDGDVLNGRNWAIRSTWAAEKVPGVDVRFFVGGGSEPLQEDEIRIPGCEGTDYTYQAAAMFRYAVENNYDFMLITDSDVYVDIRAALATDFAEFDYVGCPVGTVGETYGDTNLYGFMQGHAVWYSRKALVIVAAELVLTALRLIPTAVGTQILATLHCPDVWTAQVLIPRWRTGEIKIKDDRRYGAGPCSWHFCSTDKGRIPTWLHEVHRKVTGQ